MLRVVMMWCQLNSCAAGQDLSSAGAVAHLSLAQGGGQTLAIGATSSTSSRDQETATSVFPGVCGGTLRCTAINVLLARRC